ncbi:hypothetical protein CEXT_454421, partial [Caerostris extrusa]
AATMKLQDAYNDFSQCLSELSGSRKVALESIANSLEPQWRDFPEFQAESGRKGNFQKFFQVWFSEEEKFHKRNSEIFCNIEILLASLPKKGRID